MAEPLDLTGLQDRQAAYDTDFWAHASGNATIEHTLSHMAKLLGKLGGYVEETQHGERPSSEVLITEVIPDLAIFAARLSNLMDPQTRLDLGLLIEAREQQLRARFSASPAGDSTL